MWAELVRRQHGVVTRSQALAAGVSRHRIAANLRAHRWRRVFAGVYATFTGPLPRRSQLWAAALRAGPAAMLSHESAAELVGLVERPNGAIHITVPAEQKVVRVPGVVVHRSRRATRIRHPSRTPPQTRVEETVLDLTQSARCVEDAIGWLAKAVGARVSTPDRLLACLRLRGKVRWRRLLHAALLDIDDGCHSLLELLYLRNVERAHGLPRGERQVRRADQHRYDDVVYRAYRTRVELDGQAVHPSHRRWRDHRRDNSAVTAGDRPLRYGLADVDQSSCAVAAEVVGVLKMNGWTGVPRACSRPDCDVRGSSDRL